MSTKHTQNTPVILTCKPRSNKSVAIVLQLEFGEQVQPVTHSNASAHCGAPFKQQTRAHRKH